MIISHSSKLIFVHIQRTGGSTVINLLKKRLGENVEIISQHGNAKSEEVQLINLHKDYFTFAFVRNPWDRILSWYLLVIKNNQESLEEEERKKYENFLELDLASPPENLDFHYNQLDYISNHEEVLLTDHIFRFENYKNEIDELFNKLNLPLIEIPQLNPTWKKDYRDYYTIKSQALIAEKCKKDIDYFNYKF